MTVITTLSQLKPVQASLQLKHAETGEVLKGKDKKPLTFHLVSLESQRFFANAVERSKEEADITDEQKNDPMFLRLREAKYLAGSVTGWSHPEIFGKYSYERAVELFADVELEWIAAQVKKHVGERANFFVK